MKKTAGTSSILRIRLLPGLALKGIRSNSNVYYPFFAAGVFSVFTYFVFSSILKNDIIAILPKSTYAWVMLELGKMLLSVILFLFLLYANSFLIKRRQKEFGLYNILGLEKKHISIIMFFETLLLYIGVVSGGIITGVALSKLMFLILLRVCRLPTTIRFVFDPGAFLDVLVYFGIVFILNFAGSLWQIGRAKPVELMSGSKRGEREPKLLWICALSGLILLGIGYYYCITSKLDSMIFIDFFLAAFLIIIGTYLLFTSGIIAFLKWIRARKALYYKPQNFITVSGMLYRMKKSAASLSNLCIFSTMTIITLICTTALCIGMDECTHFMYPYDISLCYEKEKLDAETLAEELDTLEQKYGIAPLRADLYDMLTLPVRKSGTFFTVRPENYAGIEDLAEDYQLDLLLLDDYNRIEGCQLSLSDEEILIFCSGEDYGYDSVDFYGKKLSVREELQTFFPKPKARRNTFGARYIIVVKDQTVRDACVRAWCEENGIEDFDAFYNSEKQYVQLLFAEPDQEKTAFLEEFGRWGQSRQGFSRLNNDMDQRNDLRIMYGALLFIGILFGLIFFMCLILIMYYKQISEGYEDRNNFDIMQKVGMSGREIHAAVHRQILMVFALPLVGAFLHTSAGMFMVKNLLAVVSLFDMKLLTCCSLSVAAVFALVYIISYLVTAKTYYRIVSR